MMLLEKIHRKFVTGLQYSYSQEGEDLILARIFEGQKTGFYVDVGAHHPTRFSNTYYFYRRGWRGINIDAMPGSMKKFNGLRKRDINLEVPIAIQSKVQTFHIFNEPALNSFDKELSEQRESEGEKYQIIKKVDIRTKRLEDVLKEWLPKGQKIDFMSVDVEGMDLDVLRSNNWTLYRPKYLIAEIDELSFDLDEDEIVQMMKAHDYDFYAKCVKSIILKDRSVDA